MDTIEQFVDSTSISNDPDALRARMKETSHLFFRQLLPPDAVRNVHGSILSLCQQSDWADSDGYAKGKPRIEGEDAFATLYDRVQRLENFHALPHRREIINVVRALVEEEVLPHPRNIARIIFPQAEAHTTPAHQDFIHVQGSPDTYTAWIPLVDCPRDLGGVAILPGTHQQSIFEVVPTSGAGGLGIDTKDFSQPWLSVDYKLGDVLIFHSHTVHRGLPNVTGNKLRFSVDYRYQGVSEPITEGSLLPHHGRLTWDQVYEDWEHPDNRYYWHGHKLTISEHDPSYYEKARKGA